MGDKMRFNDDDYGEQYEPTDSEDNYSEEDKELLKKVRQGHQRKQDSKQPLLAFAESDDDDDDDKMGEDDDQEMNESDIEGAEDDTYMPDSKAWGKNTRDFYNTDFVDPDYSTYTEKELEMAQHEEEEAMSIQQRLAKEMNEADFEFDQPTTTAGSDNEATTKEEEDFTNIKTDLSGLSKRQKLQFFAKDSPEFAGLVEDLFFGLNECETLLIPVLEYAARQKLPLIPALEFARVMNILLTTYCSNINFYLMLKANRSSIKSHPIAKRLLQFKNMLEELSDRYDNIVKPQLEALLERIQDGDIFEVIVDESAKRLSSNKKVFKGDKTQHSTDDEEEGGETEDEAATNDVDERRGITYQISKNKGLTPHRKKELRNPRVKHRSKFRKALIRRKGAVRTVRKETKRYGGEVSGIKATVSKSVKFK